MICSRISWGAASSCCKMVCYCGVVNIYHSCQQHTFHGLVYHVFELLQLLLACDSITSSEYSDSLLQSCIYLYLRLIQDSCSSNSKHLMITSHDMGTSKTKSFEIKRNSCIRNFYGWNIYPSDNHETEHNEVLHSNDHGCWQTCPLFLLFVLLSGFSSLTIAYDFILHYFA